jgi:hypothetical protein
VNEVVARRDTALRDRLGIVAVDIARQERGQPGLHRRAGTLDLGEQLRARHTTPAELRVAVAHVPGPPQPRADVVLQVAREVQRQRPGRIGNGRQLPPDRPLVGVGLELAPERAEVAIENGGDTRRGGGSHAPR